MADVKQVRATELGFYKGRMIPAGTQFSVPAEFKAKWVVEVTPGAAPEPQKVNPTTQPYEPTTLSEMARSNRGRRPIGLKIPEPLDK